MTVRAFGERTTNAQLMLDCRLQRRSGPPVHQADFVTDEMGANDEA